MKELCLVHIGVCDYPDIHFYFNRYDILLLNI